jgi:hypothetical protein
MSEGGLIGCHSTVGARKFGALLPYAMAGTMWAAQERRHRLRPGNGSRSRPLNGYGSRVGGHLGNSARPCRIDRQLQDARLLPDDEISHQDNLAV